ncbi:MAG: phosphopantothenoylcysteine decarboxylase [Acetobacteraceae bacterium]|nr:phosphopantothenoylcysteine decarboxylase [Acetobacteraceae bacterium]
MSARASKPDSDRCRSRLAGVPLVLGVTGSIAAYKAAELVRLLVMEGARVHVVMTGSATRLVAPATFRVLSGNPVGVSLFSEPRRFEAQHVALAEDCRAVVVAPATANLLGKVACGIADDLLTTVIIAAAARRPVVLAPAMNAGMYLNPVVQENLAKLRRLGYRVVGPVRGPLASGADGEGRLAPLEDIVDEVVRAVSGEG